MTTTKRESEAPITTELAKEFIREQDHNSSDVFSKWEWDAIINNLETGVWDRKELDKNIEEIANR